MSSETPQDDLTLAITWALDRILDGEYREARDGAGNFDSMILDADFGQVNPVRAKRSRPARHAQAPYREIPADAGSRCALEFRQLLPDLMRRAKILPAPPAFKPLPEYVNRFLLEASRCLLYGQFLAALFLCRSALGETAAVTLRQRGLAAPPPSSKEAGLGGIFKLAHDRGILNSTQHRQAEEIRALATRAIHGPQSLTESECLVAFTATLEIVQALAA